jgi:hypothetical protein
MNLGLLGSTGLAWPHTPHLIALHSETHECRQAHKGAAGKTGVSE